MALVSRDLARLGPCCCSPISFISLLSIVVFLSLVLFCAGRPHLCSSWLAEQLALSCRFPAGVPPSAASALLPWLRVLLPAKLGSALSLSLCLCSPCRESLASSPARLHFLRSLLQLYCRARSSPLRR
uniref:Transmembrane protein n=1 Tax=Zea mays TaxID=4577 RepID=A0A804QIX0_MAIZE